MSEDTLMTEAPWEPLEELLERRDTEGVQEFVEHLDAEEQRRVVSRLDLDQREILIELLGADEGADLLEHLVPQQAIEILEELSPEFAADVVEELSEELGGELLREMDEDESAAILKELEDPEDSEAFRRRLEFDPKSAGGLMATHYLAFSEQDAIGDVLRRIGESAEDDADLEVQYAYAIDGDGILTGVLPVLDLVRSSWKRRVESVMIRSPHTVHVDTPLQELRRIFDEKAFVGLPVVDESGRLCGVVSRGAVRRASSSEQTDTFLKISGIVNGIVLGILLGAAAFLWKGNIFLGLVVAVSLALNTVLSVLLGGLVPLALKRFGVDPALASGPILTTCTDMCGFFLVLSLASAFLAQLS